MQGKKQYHEKPIPSFRLSERVPEDNFYRRLKEVLDLQWLYGATEKYYGREGHKSIDPVVFFKLILIGYLENLLSDRRIIQTVSLRLDLLYFIGYNLDEPLPWHSTLSRTRQLLGEEVFRALFLQVLRQCARQGMVKGKRQAIDSAHIKANASMGSLREKEIVQQGEAYTRALTEEDGEGGDGGDKGAANTVSARKYQEVQWHHQWKRKAYQHEASAGCKRARFVSNHTHYSTTDPDARVAVKPGKPRQLNYLAQLSVDTAAHVITHIQAHHADKKDSQCLSAQLTHTLSNVKAVGLKVREVLCDAGYSSGRALKALKQQKITGYIPNTGLYKAQRPGFHYIAEGDYYQCSQGVKLPFKGIKTTAHNGLYPMRVYRSSSLDCRHCPIRAECIGKSNCKRIEDTQDKDLYQQMHERM